MVEQVAERLDGSKAYSVAMENLKSTWSFPEALRINYPKKHFYYGEDGRGLVLSHNLVYVSSSTVEEIMLVDGSIEIKDGLFLKKPEFKSLGGKIPEGTIGEVIKFTGEVEAAMKNFLRQTRDGKSQAPTNRIASALV